MHTSDTNTLQVQALLPRTNPYVGSFHRAPSSSRSASYFCFELVNREAMLHQKQRQNNPHCPYFCHRAVLKAWSRSAPTHDEIKAVALRKFFAERTRSPSMVALRELIGATEAVSLRVSTRAPPLPLRSSPCSPPRSPLRSSLSSLAPRSSPLDHITIHIPSCVKQEHIDNTYDLEGGGSDKQILGRGAYGYVVKGRRRCQGNSVAAGTEVAVKVVRTKYLITVEEKASVRREVRRMIAVPILS
jgi:hypothetical protein